MKRNNKIFTGVMGVLLILLTCGMIGGTAFAQELTGKQLKVAITGDWLPIAVKSGDGYEGLAPDILDSFAAEQGMELIYVDAATYEEALTMTESGKADLMAVNVGYPYTVSGEMIRLTEPYLESQMMMICHKNTELSGRTEYALAEVKGYPEYSNNERLQRAVFDTPQRCLHAIRSGQADLMYCDIFTGSVYTQRYENRDLVSFPINTETWYRFGVSAKADSELVELLNAKIEGLSRDDINSSLTKSRHSLEVEAGDFVYHYPYEIICVILMTAFLTVMLFATYYRIKSRQSIALQGYMESYCMLADSVGEAAMAYDFQEDSLEIFGKYADKLLLPLKIENFSAYLERPNRGISLTKEQFEDILIRGMNGESYDTELRCRVKGGGWHHFRLVFSVISTEESYKRPIRLVGCLVNMEDSYQEKEHFRQLSLYDQLTGVFNRAGLEWKLEENKKFENHSAEDMLLLIDVDDFKKFNDTYGHQCGDDVLTHVGGYLRRIFRREDLICRWGGDEFLVYVVGAASHMDVIRHRCESLQRRMRNYRYEDREIPVTISIGGALLGERTLDEAFQAADQALYRVKEQGRNDIYIEQEYGEQVYTGQE